MLVARLKGANKLTDLSRTFGVHRSSYNYWVARKSIIKPEKVKQLAEVKRIHSLSNGSAGARTIAIIVGLFGVVAIVQPGSDDFSMLSILAIVGMLGFAGRDLASRAAPARVNTTLLGLYGFGAIVVVGGLFSVWQQQPFVVIGENQIIYLLAAIIAGVALGLLVFGEPLSQDMQLGSILIISSGLLLTSFRRR